MEKIPADEFFELFFQYKKSYSQVTSIEKALEDIKRAHNFSDQDVNEIREYVLDLMEAEE